MKQSILKKIFISTAAVMSLTMVTAEANDAELAQELTNPIADLLTIPIQMTYDRNIGPDDKSYKLQEDIQTVIPFDVKKKWKLLMKKKKKLITGN